MLHRAACHLEPREAASWEPEWRGPGGVAIGRRVRTLGQAAFVALGTLGRESAFTGALGDREGPHSLVG